MEQIEVCFINMMAGELLSIINPILRMDTKAMCMPIMMKL